MRVNAVISILLFKEYIIVWQKLEWNLCIIHNLLSRMGFSSVPRLPGWSFQQLIYGGPLPPPHCPDMSGPAVSPTDKLRKDSALTPVTSEKSILFCRIIKIVIFFKGLGIIFWAFEESAKTVKCMSPQLNRPRRFTLWKFNPSWTPGGYPVQRGGRGKDYG